MIIIDFNYSFSLLREGFMNASIEVYKFHLKFYIINVFIIIFYILYQFYYNSFNVYNTLKSLIP